MTSLITLLEGQISEANTNQSEESQQRERNHRYYNMMPLGNETPGYSHYIDPCVFESVEDKKALFAESFLGNRQPAKFCGSNHDEAAAKGAYVMQVLKANKYAKLFRDGWHDAFVAKKMTIWVDFRRNREQTELKFNAAQKEQINQQLSQMGQVTNVDGSQLQRREVPSFGTQPQVIYSGTAVVEVDKSYIHLDLIQPEYVMRDLNQTYAEDALWNAARMDMPKLQLIEWGFDEEQVDALNMEYKWGSSEEDLARKSSTRTDTKLRTGDQETATIYKTRTWLSAEDFDKTPGLEDFEPDINASIYEIYWGHGEVLKWNDGTPAVKKLDAMDVYEWCEFPIAHSASGLCTGDVEAHQQKAGSGLKRGVMDNLNLTNNPRWEANTAGLKDPRDLFDNQIGGVIETNNLPVGQIKALDQPQLSPMIVPVMQMLDRDSQARRGMSDLASGMNMGAVNNQNAADMIERLTNAGQRRVAMAVRDFANSFYIPMLQCIVKYARLYDKSQSQLESGGKQIPIIPAQWSDDYEMEIEVALTPDEAQTMAQRMLAINAVIVQDPDLKPLYGIAQKHALFDNIYELMGVKDATRFLAPPQSKEVQAQLKSTQQTMQQAQQRQQKIEDMNLQLLRDQQELNWQKLNNDIMDTLHDNKLDDEELRMETYFRQKELDLERLQQRNVTIGR